MDSINKNFSWAAGGVALTKIVSPIFSLAIARHLSPSEFGNYSLALLIVFSIDFIKEFGFTDAIIASDGDNIDRKIGEQFSIQIAIAITYILLLLPISFFLDTWFGTRNVGLMVRVLSFVLLAKSYSDPIITKYVKNREFKPIFFRSIIPTIIYGVTSLGLLTLGYSEVSLAIGYGAGEIALAFFLAVSTKSLMKIRIRFSNPEFFKFGFKIVSQRISTGLFLSKFDGLILGYSFEGSIFGTYRMSRNLTNVIPSAFLKELSNVIFSEISNTKNENRIREIYIKYGIYGSMLLLLAVTIAVPLFPTIVPLLIGKQWIIAVVPMQLFAILLPSYQIRNTQQAILKAQNKLNEITIILAIYSVFFLLMIAYESALEYNLSTICKSIIILDSTYTFFHCFFFTKETGIKHSSEFLFFMLFLSQIIVYSIIL